MTREDLRKLDHLLRVASSASLAAQQYGRMTPTPSQRDVLGALDPILAWAARHELPAEDDCDPACDGDCEGCEG